MNNATVRFMKDNLDELVYSSVKVEGIGATFAQTREIVRDGLSRGVPAGDVQKIVGIKRGLQYLFEHYEEDVSWELYSRYNALIGEGNVPKAGEMRGPGEVHVDDYVPEDVSIDRFYGILETAVGTSHHDPLAAACIMQLNLAKAQFFHDGNKRSSLLLANHMLAHEDAGSALIVRERDRDLFLDLLVSYYYGEIGIDDAAWDLEELAATRPAEERGLDSDRPAQMEPERPSAPRRRR